MLQLAREALEEKVDDVKDLKPLATQTLSESDQQRLANLGNNGPRDVAGLVMTHCVPNEHVSKTGEQKKGGVGNFFIGFIFAAFSTACASVTVGRIQNPSHSFGSPGVLRRACFHAVSDHFRADTRLVVDFPHLRAIGGSSLTDRALPVREGDRVLDVGCGFGDTAIKLARLAGSAGEVIGIDCCDAFLEIARKDVEARGLRGGFGPGAGAGGAPCAR